MAYDEEIADRVRDLLAPIPDTSERKMFGGIAFMVAGNMACGLTGSDLMVRLGEDAADAALDEPHTRPMDFTGKALRSMVYVDAAGVESDAALRRWVERGVAFARGLPPK